MDTRDSSDFGTDDRALPKWLAEGKASRARRLARLARQEQAPSKRASAARTAIKQPSPPKRDPAYSCWKAMRNRCLNPNNPNWPRYGGRGITIAPAWDSFTQFLADMGPRPDGYTLERIDNDGPYAPGNVRWASRWEQGQNRQHTPLIEHDGRRQSLGMWLKELPNPHGLKITTISSRIYNGASLLEALAHPADKRFDPRLSNKERRQYLYPLPTPTRDGAA